MSDLYTLPKSWTDTPWELRRIAPDGQSYSNGTFRTKNEAERAIRQVERLHKGSTFQVEYVGASISHFG